MSMLNRLLGLLGRYATQAMAGGVFVGLLLPDLAGTLRPGLTLAVWGLLYLAMIRIEWGALVERIRKPALILALMTWMMIVAPSLMALLLLCIEMRPCLEAALILTAASSSL